MPTIPALGRLEGENAKVQGCLLIQRDSGAFLDYMSPCLKKAINALQKLLASTHLSSSLLTKKFLNIENLRTLMAMTLASF